jgi:hypothetical protein
VWVKRAPLTSMKSSPAMWVEVALPAEPKVISFGRCRASARRSRKFCTGTEGWTTMTLGNSARIVTGVSSVRGS